MNLTYHLRATSCEQHPCEWMKKIANLVLVIANLGADLETESVEQNLFKNSNYALQPETLAKRKREKK